MAGTEMLERESATWFLNTIAVTRKAPKAARTTFRSSLLVRLDTSRGGRVTKIRGCEARRWRSYLTYRTLLLRRLLERVGKGGSSVLSIARRDGGHSLSH